MSARINQSLSQSAAASSHLPQVKANHADAVVFIDLRIGCVLRVVDLRVDPLAFVGRIVDLSGLPLTLMTARRHRQTAWLMAEEMCHKMLQKKGLER